MPEQPAAEAFGILDADAAIAEVAVRLGELRVVGRVVQVDVLRVREGEFQIPIEFSGPGSWRILRCSLPAAAAFPVDASAGSTVVAFSLHSFDHVIAVDFR